MFGSFWSSVSIAARPPGFRALAPLMADDALVGLVSVLLPVRVLDRQTPSRSRSRAGDPPKADRRARRHKRRGRPWPCRRASLAAHWPISSPALRLSVAKVASAALGGSSGVSSAITRIPALRARSIDGTIALVSFGVIRIALAPAFIKRSIASTWPVLSPSYLPARLRKSTPSSFAFASAPSFIFAKNGLVYVFVISPTMILSAAKAGANESAHAAIAQAVIVFQRAPRWIPMLVVIRSSL